MKPEDVKVVGTSTAASSVLVGFQKDGDSYPCW